MDGIEGIIFCGSGSFMNNFIPVKRWQCWQSQLHCVYLKLKSKGRSQIKGSVCHQVIMFKYQINPVGLWSNHREDLISSENVVLPMLKTQMNFRMSYSRESIEAAATVLDTSEVSFRNNSRLWGYRSEREYILRFKKSLLWVFSLFSKHLILCALSYLAFSTSPHYQSFLTSFEYQFIGHFRLCNQSLGGL